MKSSNKSANPFYILLVAIGLVFVITATAYGVMTVRAIHSATAEAPTPEHPLMTWMNHHGNTALIVELALLAACTVGAIATDEYWQRRSTRSNDNAR